MKIRAEFAMVLLVLLSCVGKAGAVSQSTPEIEKADISSLGTTDKQFVSSLESGDLALVRTLVDGGFDLWHEVDFRNIAKGKESQVRSHPIFFLALANKSVTLIDAVLRFAASQKVIAPGDYGLGPGRLAALRFAVENRLFGSIGPILKIWPWQLTTAWDMNESSPDRPSIFYAVSSADREMVDFLLNAGCPPDLEFKRWYGFSLYPIDVAKNNELRSLLLSRGAKDFITFENKNWTLLLLNDAALMENKDSGSKITSTLPGGASVRLLGRTTGERDRLIRIVAPNGKQGFIDENKIKYEWGSP